MIRRWSALLWIVLILASAFGLFRVKYRVQTLNSEVTALNLDLERERESLRVAEAEWAYLTRPSRLQRLSDRYLHLQPVQARQVETLDMPLKARAPAGMVTQASAVAPQAEGE